MHHIEEFTSFSNVCAAFSVKRRDCNTTLQYPVLLSALLKTVAAIPLLGCVVIRDEINSVYFRQSSRVEDCMSYDYNETESLPSTQSMSALLGEYARRPSDNSAHLFSLKTAEYSNGILFLLVVNHAITDGPSVFVIVDTFMNSLAAALGEADFTRAPSVPGRDLIAEVLADPRCSGPLDPRFAEPPALELLTFPGICDGNVNADNNGCIRVVYREFSPKVTSAILSSCHRNGVSFQALLSSAATLALLKLLHAHGELDAADWNLPMYHMAPANMRRFLHSSEEQSVERCVSVATAYMRWKVSDLKNYQALAERDFWPDFVLADAHKPIQDILSSSYLHQSLHRGESGATPYAQQLQYSITTTSVGNISVLKEQYGHSLVVDDLVMQVGTYSPDWEHCAQPAVPDAAINCGTPGYVLLHAYTIFGRLKLSGDYYGYATEYITPYYDEIVRILTLAGTEAGASESLKVGDVFSL